MLAIKTKPLKISDDLRRKIEIIGRFTNTKPNLKNGSIINIVGTNIAYVEPHRIIINSTTFLIFEESKDIFINNLSNKIKFAELEDYIKNMS